jgi:RsiW-degrading membrane proteinase PrsW (M82 family)
MTIMVNPEEENMTSNNPWARLSSPARIGLVFATVAVLLSIAGILRNPATPMTLQSVLVATLISGLTWGLIAWAIATAVVDVEDDIEERDGAPLE